MKMSFLRSRGSLMVLMGSLFAGLVAHANADDTIFPATVPSVVPVAAPAASSGASSASGDQFPTDPDHPTVPNNQTPNGDIKDSGLGTTPAPLYELRGGYAATANDAGVNSGAGVGVALILDGARTGIQIGGQVAGTQGGLFAYAQGDAKVRYRVPLDPNHIIWGGIGLDISGQGAVDPKAQSYLTVQLPVAFIGTMFNVGGNCVIRIFAKAALGVFDNQGQAAGSQWGASLDTMAKPMVGGEALAACGSVRVTADYQHVFDFGQGGATDRAEVDFSQAFPITSDGSIQLGYFLKGQYEHEDAVSGVAAGAPGSLPANIGAAFAGLEVRFGSTGKFW